MSWFWWHWTCIRLPVLYEGRRTKSAIYCPSVLLAKAGERLQELTVITHIWHLGCIQAKQTKTNNASGDGHHDARASHRHTHSFGKRGSRHVYGSCANSAAPCPHALIGFHDMALESIGCFRWTDGGPVHPWIEALLTRPSPSCTAMAKLRSIGHKRCTAKTASAPGPGTPLILPYSCS